MDMSGPFVDGENSQSIKEQPGLTQKPTFGNQTALFGSAGRDVNGHDILSEQGAPPAGTLSMRGAGNSRGRGGPPRGGAFKNRTAVFNRPQGGDVSSDDMTEQASGRSSEGSTAMSTADQCALLTKAANLPDSGGDASLSPAGTRNLSQFNVNATSVFGSPHSPIPSFGGHVPSFASGNLPGGSFAPPSAFGSTSFTTSSSSTPFGASSVSSGTSLFSSGTGSAAPVQSKVPSHSQDSAFVNQPSVFQVGIPATSFGSSTLDLGAPSTMKHTNSAAHTGPLTERPVTVTAEVVENQASVAPSVAPAVPANTLSAFLRKPKSSNSGSLPASALQSSATSPAPIYDEEERAQRFAEMPANNRFFEMKDSREALRLQYIASGILPDPNRAQDLADAQKLIGTCTDMCPEFEREEREFQKELDRWEMFPGTTRADPKLAVKKYRRPAAGREVPLPEDVRPPHILKTTLDYLFHELLPPDPFSPRYAEVHPFLWDRTRAIRQDFIVQSQRGPLTIECHERIARFHILSLHLRGGFDAEGKHAEGWSEQQELEQLRKTLRSLIEYYDDARDSGETSPNEAEFRAYNVLLHLRDPETLREVELLPTDTFVSPVVQSSLRLRSYAQRSNNLEKRGHPRNTEATLNFYSRFFAELRTPQTNYLQACLAENVFPGVRLGAVKAMGKAYLANHKATPANFVASTLGTDGADQMLEIAELFNIKVISEQTEDGEQRAALAINKTNALPEDRTLSGSFSMTIVEAKRASFTNQDVIDGHASGAEPLIPSQIAAQPSIHEKLSPPHMPVGKTSAASLLSQKTQTVRPSLPKDAVFAQSFKPANPSPLAQPTTPESSAARSTDSNPSSFGTFISPSVFELPASSASNDVSIAKPTSDIGPTSAFGIAKSSPSIGTFNPTFSSFSQPNHMPTATIDSSQSADTSHLPETELPISQAAAGTTPLGVPAARKRQRPVDLSDDAPPARRAEPPAVKSGYAEDHSPDVSPKRSSSYESTRFASQEGRATAALAEVADPRETEPREQEIVAAAARAREELENRKRAREDWMDNWISDLLLLALDIHLGRRVRAHARHALAGAFHDRQTLSAAMRKWRRGLEEAREERRMYARLQLVRQRLKDKELGRSLGTSRAELSGDELSESHSLEMLKSDLRASRVSMSTSLHGQKHQFPVHTDSSDERSAIIKKAREDRQALWTAGAFLHLLAERVEQILSLIQSELVTCLTTLLFICDDGPTRSNTSLWLRSRFALLPGESVVNIDISPRTMLQVVDVSEGTESLQSTQRDVGVTFFALSPSFAQSSLWQREKDQLAELSQQPAVWGGRLKPALVLMVWTSPAFLSAFSPIQSLRAHQIRSLLLDAATALRWSHIEVAELGHHKLNTDDAMRVSLQGALPTLVWNPLRAQTSLESFARPLVTSWARTVDSAVSSLGQLYDLQLTANPKASALAVDTLAALMVLANDALKALQDVSHTICDEGEVVSLPYVLRASATRDVDEALLRAAQDQIDRVQINDESVLLALRVQLHDALTGKHRFPLRNYVHSMLQVAMSQLELVWLGVSVEMIHPAPELRLPSHGRTQHLGDLRILKAAELIDSLGESLTDHISAGCRTVAREVHSASGNNRLASPMRGQSPSPELPIADTCSTGMETTHIANLKAAMAKALHLFKAGTS